MVGGGVEAFADAFVAGHRARVRHDLLGTRLQIDAADRAACWRGARAAGLRVRGVHRFGCMVSDPRDGSTLDVVAVTFPVNEVAVAYAVTLLDAVDWLGPDCAVDAASHRLVSRVSSRAFEVLTRGVFAGPFVHDTGRGDVPVTLATLLADTGLLTGSVADFGAPRVRSVLDRADLVSTAQVL